MLSSHLPIPSDYPHRQALLTAIELARLAGAMLLDVHRQGPQRIERKRTQVDLVTEADIASQEMIMEGLAARFPDYGILAEEEGGRRQSQGGALWLVDPLDGTTNFASRFPVFGVSIALWIDHEPVVGVIQDVVRERTYWAAAGQGAWMDLERKLRVSDAAALDQSLLATGFPYSRATAKDINLVEFNYLIPRVRGVRRAGAASLDMAWLADGRLDGYWEANLASWDWAAGVLLVQEAGGVISDYAGRPWRLDSPTIVAANPYLHPHLLQAVQTARRAAGLEHP
ncbi:MAG: inositol monophosphatase [Chloroflexi bacterium]|nr:inositol monophosphatase [Chloroflexota bacterium]